MKYLMVILCFTLGCGGDGFSLSVDAGPDASVDIDAGLETDGGTDGDTDTDTETSTDSDVDVDTDADGDSGADLDTDTDSDTDSDTDTDSSTDVDSDTDSDTDGDTDTDTDVDSGANTDIDTDSDTGPDLVWSDSIIPTQTWEEAREACDNGWRLPNVQELATLIRGCDQDGCEPHDPDCQEHVCLEGCTMCESFQGPGPGGCYWPDTLGDQCDVQFWTSTEVTNEPQPLIGAFIVNFYKGVPDDSNKTFYFSVLCVKN
jgi:hypothetical protein